MELTEIRKNIDDIDARMIELFRDRMALCAEVAAYKKQVGKPVRDPARERELLSRVQKLAGEPYEMYARILYATMLDVSNSYQTGLCAASTPLQEKLMAALENSPKLFPQKGMIACQGVEGAYSQIACEKLFPMPDILYFRNFEGVFQAVEQGLCDYGVLPIENSSYGSVNAVYDLMRHYNFHIVRSIKVHIDHNLLAKPGVRQEDIREIVSHEQAIGQCSSFLNKLQGVKITVCDNTAAAAKMVAESDRRDIAAISSNNCAALYGLSALVRGIQNNDNNYTRFICIARDLAIYPGAERISLMLTVAHSPGALYRVMSRFAVLGINLCKIESRPIPGQDFAFMFYFDLDASLLRPEVMTLIDELSKSCETFVFLGSYSEAT